MPADITYHKGMKNHAVFSSLDKLMLQLGCCAERMLCTVQPGQLQGASLLLIAAERRLCTATVVCWSLSPVVSNAVSWL
jgi:hypothetical protein